MMKLCGATFEQSESAINIAKDEVMNNNVNNNTVIEHKSDIDYIIDESTLDDCQKKMEFLLQF